MGVGATCCAARRELANEQGEDDLRLRIPLVLDKDGLQSPASPSMASPLTRCRGNHLVQGFGTPGLDMSVEREWQIVADSIDADECRALRALHDLVQDLVDHPACSVEPLCRQPQTLLRFLRARDVNVAQAERMFRDMLDWRRDFRVEEKVRQWNEELENQSSPKAIVSRRYCSDAEMCLDKYGIPVRLMRLSVADAEGGTREFGRETVLVDSLSKLELTHRQIRMAMFSEGLLIRGQVQIIDVGDYGEYGIPNWTSRMWAAFKHGPDMYKVFDLNYPETVRTVFIIRIGALTSAIWRLATPLVPRRTKRKLRIYGWQAKHWVGELKAELRPHQPLPAFLREDSPQAFASATPAGGIIPVGAVVPSALGAPEQDVRGRAVPVPTKVARSYHAPAGLRPAMLLLAFAAFGAAALAATLGGPGAAAPWQPNGSSAAEVPPPE